MRTFLNSRGADLLWLCAVSGVVCALLVHIPVPVDDAPQSSVRAVLASAPAFDSAVDWARVEPQRLDPGASIAAYDR